MSFSLRARRLLVGAAAGAMVLGLLPAGIAAADNHVPDLCDNAPSAPFTDKGTTHADAIDCLYAYEITGGQTATTFGTFNPLTRGQAATLFVNFAMTATDGDIADEVDDSVTVPFTDIAGTTHQTNIEILYRLGLITGTSATTYSPNAQITRAQFATILYNAHLALGVDFDDTYPDAFTDVAGSVHRASINALAGEGIINGLTPTTYGPSQNVLRGQTASLLIASAGVLDAADLWDAPALPGTIGPNPTFTDAPELVSVERAAAGVVRYNFDKPIPGIAVNPDNFRLYDPAGNVSTPDTASIAGSTVTVRFGTVQTPDVGAVSSAVRAGVRTGAVADASGLLSIAGDFALTATAAQVQALNPNLTAVRNYRFADDIQFGEQRVLVDFVFADQGGALGDDIETYTGAEIGASFSLIGVNSQVFPALDEVANVSTSANVTTVTVAFAVDPTEVPQAQLRRGVFDDGDVVWTASFGATNGVTVDPDLVSVEREGSSTIFRFVFDEAVSAIGADLDETAFYLVNSGLNTQVGQSITRSALAADGARVVRVNFGNLDAFGVPVHAFVLDGGVRATDSTDSDNDGYNQPGSSAISVPVIGDPVPGVTAGLDLVSAQRVQDAVTGRFSIRLTFDQSIVLADVTDGDYEINLYDAAGVRFEVNTGGGGISVAGPNNTVLVITSANTSISDDQLEATVTASVQNDAAGATPAPMTEGQVDARPIVTS